jgi:xanthine dehydrogenase accessory protein XdhC
MSALPLSATLARLLAEDEPAILVTIAEAQGSTPREQGAAMLVTTGGSRGTVGGGQLEYHAIDTARVMLARGDTARDLDMPLGPLLGQCCGGRVRLRLELGGPEHVRQLAAEERNAEWSAPTVLVFGCGHTGRALARALARLPFRTTLVDDRLDVEEDVPEGVRLLRLDDPAEAVAAAPSGAATVIMTHSHALDYRLTDAALRRGDAAYVGMIGSATKRARFERFFIGGGGDKAALGRFSCPIGGGDVSDKRPEVIASLVSAELIRAFARWRAGEPARAAAAEAP